MRETPRAPGTSAGSQASAQTPRPWHPAARTSCVALASAHTTIERSADAVASHAAPPCPPAAAAPAMTHHRQARPIDRNNADVTLC